MKIFVISSLFVIILISGVFTISLCLEEPEPFKSLEELADFPMLVFYNGTRFHLKEFNPINFEEKNMVFSLSIDILIEDYSDVIYVFSENSNIPTIIKAENEGEENGTYKIKDLYIKPNGDIDKYPYDEYRCKLTFKSINETYDKIFNYYQMGNVSSYRWYMDGYGSENKLYFRFHRVQEIKTYEVLKFVGSSLFFINILTLLTFTAIYSEKIKNNILKSLGNMGLYLGYVIGIPFYTSVIFNHILNSPNYESKYIVCLISLTISSLVLGTTIFVLREHIKKS